MLSADWLERFGHLQRLPPLEAEVALARAVPGVRHLRRGPAAIVPLAVAWLALAHAVLFFGSPRFHHALLSALALLAAAEVVAWARAVRPARTA